MSVTHPFVGYNKVSERPRVLVGNWSEEQALADATGQHRYSRWTAGLEHSASEPDIYAHTCSPAPLPAAERTLTHSERVEENEWSSTLRAVHSAEHALRSLNSSRHASVGYRTTRSREQLLTQAQNEVQEEESEPVHEIQTTHRETFTPPDLPKEPRGRRIMKTQDGVPVPIEQRDEKLLAEQGVPDRSLELAKSQRGALSETHAALPPSEACKHYSRAIGTTIHTQRLAEGQQPELSTLPSSESQPGPAGTFGRKQNFTRPMDDPFKEVISE